jgi:hypothetical protein
MVIIIMVILMVSFLVGGYGLSHAIQKDRGGQTWGSCRYGKVTYNELLSADNDLNVLAVLNQAVRDLDFGAVSANLDNAALAYALLRKEADRSNVMVTGEDVDVFLRQRGWEGARLESLLTQLRTRMPSLSDSRLREIITEWLKVQTAFYRAAFAAACPGRFGAATSEEELRHLYRDLAERIDLRVAVIRAQDYLKDVPDPSAEEVQAQFEAFRAERPGQVSKTNPFGFGYVQPDRARIRYLLIRQDVVQRVARPTEEEIRSHYIRYRDRYVKAAPAPERSAAATSAPARVPMSFAEAKPRIAEELTAAAVTRAMDDLVSQVTLLIDQYATEQRGTIGDAYDYALFRMTAPAETVLARELTDLNLRGEPLEAAVAALADKAGLVAIAFPWGQQGQRRLDPDVKVTLKAERTTLGEALASICTQVKCPTLKWVMLRPLPGLLFAAAEGGVDFFPVEVRDTPPMDIQQMLSDEVLGRSQTAAGEALVRVVFMAEPFLPRAGETG